MATAKILIELASDGTIRAEAPSYGGAARCKITVGKVPSWIWEELTEQQATIDAREAARQIADARVRAEIAARAVAVNSRTPAPKHHSSRALIFNTMASRPGKDSREFAFKTIGTPRRGEREDFLARPAGSNKPWQHITIYDEAPATWCARNGWERPKGARNLPRHRNPARDSNQVGI